MEKSIEKVMHLGIDFWKDFGGFLEENGAKMEEKSMQKRCQKHVGIDLEVKVAKTRKMQPLQWFFMVFEVKLGPKSIKNR